ncbi:MAG: PIN domain-containing protein [Planctomycetes bacterium]|nr:PIN domain-containing protein [Planctomycetota bacterium]
MKPLILDSSALLAVLFKEVGAAFVIDNIHDAGVENYIHGVNACEVAYKLIGRGFDPGLAWKFSPFAGIRQIDLIKGQIGDRVVSLKTAHPFLSIADCFAISLGEKLKGRVLTSDKRFSEADTSAEIVPLRD